MRPKTCQLTRSNATPKQPDPQQFHKARSTDRWNSKDKLKDMNKLNILNKETIHLQDGNQCGKSFPTSGRLENHKYEHENGQLTGLPNESGKFSCDECGKEYASLPGLRVHIDVVHKGLKNHICHLCGQSFGRRSCLAAHKQTHHGLGPTKHDPSKKGKKKKREVGNNMISDGLAPDDPTAT